jgi:hypothetical protein
MLRVTTSMKFGYLDVFFETMLHLVTLAKHVLLGSLCTSETTCCDTLFLILFYFLFLKVLPNLQMVKRDDSMLFLVKSNA